MIVELKTVDKEQKRYMKRRKRSVNNRLDDVENNIENYNFEFFGLLELSELLSEEA